MIKDIYKSVTAGKNYDTALANRHNKELVEAKVKAKDLPAIAETFLEENCKGGCLQIAMALLKKMHDAGREAYLAITMTQDYVYGKKDKCYASVYYRLGGSWCVADPVEEIKDGIRDLSEIPAFVFRKKKGQIWLYDPYGENGEMEFFKEFLEHPILVI